MMQCSDLSAGLVTCGQVLQRVFGMRGLDPNQPNRHLKEASVEFRWLSCKKLPNSILAQRLHSFSVSALDSLEPRLSQK